MAKWFKFYGQDWLTDAKVLKMTPKDRLCFIVLMCLAGANDTEIITNYTEESIVHLAAVSPNSGCLKRLSEMGLIVVSARGDIKLKNFHKRQAINLTNYERVKVFRKKIKKLASSKSVL